jgi:L-asparaginase
LAPIAGAQTSSSEIAYKSGVSSVDDLIKALPPLKDLADLTGEQIANICSCTMNHDVWLKLAKRVNEVLQDNNIDGIVITHGTDTLEETAYFLSLVVKSDKPIASCRIHEASDRHQRRWPGKSLQRCSPGG